MHDSEASSSIVPEGETSQVEPMPIKEEPENDSISQYAPIHIFSLEN
jgi:hypothetical protein